MAKVRRVKDQLGRVVGYSFYCVGCNTYHMFHTAEWTRPNGDKMTGWGFNGDLDHPTFTPSLLVYEIKMEGDVLQPRCHSFVRNGEVQYLADCGHAFAGMTLDLPAIKDADALD